MWPYWFLFIVPALLALKKRKMQIQGGNSKKSKHWTFGWYFIFIFFVLMIGFRHEVGGDWNQYIDMINSYKDNTSEEQFKFQDPAFVIINRVAVLSGSGVYMLNILSATFFCWGLLVFCRVQPRPWLAISVAVPYLITVVAMGYTRQSVAIGIAMVAMVALGRGRTLQFFLWVAFAALFHKSAVILLPIAILASTKRRFLTIFWAVFSTCSLFVLLLQESTSFLIKGYIESEYQSSGAAIRITMNAIPAVLFLFFKSRFQLTPMLSSFWSWMSWIAILFIGLLLISPSSTAVDRVALYWIPLQLFVLSRLPNAIGIRNGTNTGWVCAVLGYSAMVHFVWLFYADSSHAWLPYKFYPLEWLWK